MTARVAWALPDNHGLAVGRFTIRPGAFDLHGNVVVSCPAARQRLRGQRGSGRLGNLRPQRRRPQHRSFNARGIAGPCPFST